MQPALSPTCPWASAKPIFLMFFSRVIKLIHTIWLAWNQLLLALQHHRLVGSLWWHKPSSSDPIVLPVAFTLKTDIVFFTNIITLNCAPPAWLLPFQLIKLLRLHCSTSFCFCAANSTLPGSGFNNLFTSRNSALVLLVCELTSFKLDCVGSITVNVNRWYLNSTSRHCSSLTPRTYQISLVAFDRWFIRLSAFISFLFQSFAYSTMWSLQPKSSCVTLPRDKPDF